MNTSSGILSEQTSKRIFGLDVLRALAIILVVAAHGRIMVAETVLYDFPYLHYIDGVDLFFVLSGFLIGSILLREMPLFKTGGYHQVLKFWKRRWLRTLPNYYLILILNYIIACYGLTPTDANEFGLPFFVFVQNFFVVQYGFFSESWSLSIEEWFYILTPLLILAYHKVFNAKHTFLFAIFTLIAGAFFFRYYTVVSGYTDEFSLYQNTQKAVVNRLDAIAYGLLAAWFAYYYNGLWYRYRFIVFVAGVILLCTWANYDFDKNFWYTKVISFAISPIALMCFLPMAYHIAGNNKGWQKPFTFISTISYSMYLVNLPVSGIIQRFFPVQDKADGIVKYGLYWLIVIAVSYGLYTLYEKRMTKLRDWQPRR